MQKSVLRTGGEGISLRTICALQAGAPLQPRKPRQVRLRNFTQCIKNSSRSLGRWRVSVQGATQQEFTGSDETIQGESRKEEGEPKNKEEEKKEEEEEEVTW